MKTNKVWFVTGASKGLGLALSKALLAAGYPLAATSRNKEGLKEIGGASPGFLPLEVDLTDERSVKEAVEKTVETFGHIDVVVNNAGYGQWGTLEELTQAEIRRNFDVNVFGALNVIKSVMPYLRDKKSGHIINIASTGGFVGTFPGFGIYIATKFALVGLTESLSAEAKEFGIQATIVYPGYFRTNFLEKGSIMLPGRQIEQYQAARQSGKWHLEEMNGNQLGDPQKAATAFIQLAETAEPPLHFFMGSDAFQLAHQKIDLLQYELAAYESLTKSTDF
ncbi:NADP-dependent 3-hydroxy acid dehydrogenase YdfG [Arachidicoccus rhizosphaerae]|uniref:NADP-dependent 3-hydroxy acid dehydrogenase YdfG n=1 Tax=Arachidicoccus rhizosphaerae TaxID=551991 RepID=A0A1H3VGH0_9BACT|nr:oxidoreductase [Arachidicoccus rhizosphaerae]SDZ73856.1 NADP-dependent 3-hydroxy acid dehydrogenase YdfG [Arachidicoccus rhizosphaerae]